MCLLIPVSLLVILAAPLAYAHEELPPVDLTADERAWLDENPDKLRIFFDTSFPPLEYLSESGSFVGMGADVVDLVEHQLGVAFERHPSDDWNAQLAAMRSGECAISPTIVRVPEREQYIYFTTPYATVPVVIVTNRALPESMSIDDLDGRRVAVVSGYATEEYVRHHAQGHFDVVPVANASEGLRSVSFGQTDAFVGNLAVAAHYIDEEGIPNLRVAGITDYSFSFRIGVSREYPLLYSAIQKAVDTIPPHELDAIRVRWISLQIEKGMDPETVRLLQLAAAFTVLLTLGLVGIAYVLKRRLAEKVRVLHLARQQVVDQTQRLKLATEATHAGTWDYVPASGEAVFSEECYAILGYPPISRDITLDEWRELIHPDDLPGAEESLRAYVRNGGQGEFETEYRVRHHDGSWRWILGKGRAIEWDDDGTPTRLAGLNLDVQRAKEMQEELANSEARFRAVFDHAPYAIIINSLDDGRFLEANKTFLDSWRVTRDELLQMNADDIPVTGEVESEEILETLLRTGIVMDREGTFTRKDGSKAHVIYSSVLMEIKGEKQILTMTVDVTERKRAEEALKEREETFRALSENSEDVIMRFDREHRHTYTNASVERATGIPPETFIGKTHHELGFPEDLCDMWETAIEEVFTHGRVHRVEFRLPDGTWMDWLLMPEFGPDGTVDSVITSSRDITARKLADEERERLQKQLLQSQKMEAVGVLAGGVAHDFNNMLGAIIGNAELALADAGATDPLREYLAEVLNAARRSASLTRQLLAFARKQAVAPAIIDLNEAVESILKMLRRLIGEDVELVWRPCNSPSKVKMDPSQLDQILANLCVNARDAISDVGQVAIEVATVSVDESYCVAHADATPGEYVVLIVSDDGCGMDRATADHAFDPFYTTKELGEGTGLGLATVYGIVRQNEGFISLYSESGQGTTFKIYLPSHSGETATKRTSKVAEMPGSQGETVLMVEDEPALLTMGTAILRRLGYTVLSADTPGEAIRLAEEHDGDIHLLVTDVVMPEMNGRDLAERFLEIRPTAKHLFVSGYTANVIVDRGILDEGVNFIQKPYSLKDLAAIVRETLDRP